MRPWPDNDSDKMSAVEKADPYPVNTTQGCLIVVFCEDPGLYIGRERVP